MDGAESLPSHSGVSHDEFDGCKGDIDEGACISNPCRSPGLLHDGSEGGRCSKQVITLS